MTSTEQKMRSLELNEEYNAYMRQWRKKHPDMYDKQTLRASAKKAESHPEYGFIVVRPLIPAQCDEYNVNKIVQQVREQIMDNIANGVYKGVSK